MFLPVCLRPGVSLANQVPVAKVVCHLIVPQVELDAINCGVVKTSVWDLAYGNVAYNFTAL